MNGTMTETIQNERNNGLVFSLIAHAVLIIFMVLKATFFDSDSIDYQSAIRVDLVALPDKDLSPPTDHATKLEPVVDNSPKETEAPKEKLPDKIMPDETAIKIADTKKQEEPKKNKIDEKMEEKRKKEALDRIKKMSALESIKSSVETERIEKMVGMADAKSKTYKGNVISPGTELTGINKIHHENYVALLDRQIKENWTLPQWMVKKDFKAQVLVKIDQNGTVIFNQIFKTSGNTNYDDIVLETIKKSGPFPKPPEKFSAILSEKGVLIGFPE